MTRARIALLCAVAGLTVVGANALVDAIATGIYNCYPDPYFPEPCMAQEWAFLGVPVACWLVATYLLARREAISLFACAFTGLMLWVRNPRLDHRFDSCHRGSPRRRLLQLSRPLGGRSYRRALSDGVIGLLTAGVGHVMQVSMQKRRRRRLPQTA